MHSRNRYERKLKNSCNISKGFMNKIYKCKYFYDNGKSLFLWMHEIVNKTSVLDMKWEFDFKHP